MALSGYLATSFVYLGVYVLACWAMNLQYGVTGIYNLAFIIFQSAGAYTAAVLSLGPSSQNSSFQQYIGGYRLSVPTPDSGRCGRCGSAFTCRRTRRAATASE